MRYLSPYYSCLAPGKQRVEQTLWPWARIRLFSLSHFILVSAASGINVRNQLTTPENAKTYHNALCLSPPKFCVSIVFSFSWELKRPQEELKTMLMQNFGVTNKEHYGMLWYFLEWSIESSGVNIHFFCFFSLSLTTKY